MNDDIEKKLVFPYHENKFKRLFSIFQSLIKVIAYQRQYQRKKYNAKDTQGQYFQYIFITKEDVFDAIRIMKNIYGDIVGELNGSNKDCLDKIINYSKKNNTPKLWLYL